MAQLVQQVAFLSCSRPLDDPELLQYRLRLLQSYLENKNWEAAAIQLLALGDSSSAAICISRRGSLSALLTACEISLHEERSKSNILRDANLEGCQFQSASYAILASLQAAKNGKLFALTPLESRQTQRTASWGKPQIIQVEACNKTQVQIRSVLTRVINNADESCQVEGCTTLLTVLKIADGLYGLLQDFPKSHSLDHPSIDVSGNMHVDSNITAQHSPEKLQLVDVQHKELTSRLLDVLTRSMHGSKSSYQVELQSETTGCSTRAVDHNSVTKEWDFSKWELESIASLVADVWLQLMVKSPMNDYSSKMLLQLHKSISEGCQTLEAQESRSREIDNLMLVVAACWLVKLALTLNEGDENSNEEMISFAAAGLRCVNFVAKANTDAGQTIQDQGKEGQGCNQSALITNTSKMVLLEAVNLDLHRGVKSRIKYSKGALMSLRHDSLPRPCFHESCPNEIF